MAHILIVDDSAVFCAVATKVFQEMGHVVDSAQSLEEGLAALSPLHDVVFLDVDLPDGNGIEAMPAFTRSAEPPEIIVITANAEPEGAAEAVDCGAWDYVAKEASLENLRQALLLALGHRGERRPAPPGSGLRREGIVGESPRLLACLDRMARAAATDASTLLTGETGTGKELLARALHQNSARRNGPFVVMDCASIPLHLAESILFGHVRGAFTGATKSAHGLMRQAAGGTLFLDEVGELPLDIQKDFLRVLQERRFRPVGGETELQSDFRLVAATNKDLASMTTTGDFRSDLLYRINAVEIRLPALRERLADIPLLVTKYFESGRRGEAPPRRDVSPEFLAALTHYNWPGNIRELCNTLQTATVNSFGSTTLYPKHLPGYIRKYLARKAFTSWHPAGQAEDGHAAGPGIEAGFGPWKEQRNEAVAAAAKAYFPALLRHVGGDIGQACRLSSLSPQHFYATLKKYGIGSRAWRDI